MVVVDCAACKRKKARKDPHWGCRHHIRVDSLSVTQLDPTFPPPPIFGCNPCESPFLTSVMQRDAVSGLLRHVLMPKCLSCNSISL